MNIVIIIVHQSKAEILSYPVIPNILGFYENYEIKKVAKVESIFSEVNLASLTFLISLYSFTANSTISLIFRIRFKHRKFPVFWQISLCFGKISNSMRFPERDFFLPLSLFPVP